MAGINKGEFREKLSPFLKEKLAGLRARYGEDSPEVRKLALQYLRDSRETAEIGEDERRRHYEAEMAFEGEGDLAHGIERLYRRVMLIEPTTVCAAHCRYCLRGRYDPYNMSEDQLLRVARHCGDPVFRDNIREVLITGGDPFMIPSRLGYLIDAIQQNAPNIEFVRIGTRIPCQAPDRVNEDLLHAVRLRNGLRIEIAAHVNHTLELFDEVRAAFTKLNDAGCRIYNQSVLLRGVNDTADELVELFDTMRSLWIEQHYLFHCVPMFGMSHLRTTVQQGIDLIRDVVMSGRISGRAKPQYTAMTDIGKVTLYEGTILKRDGQRLLLKSSYSAHQRQRWNPNWQVPDSVELDAAGDMSVWYLDGPLPAQE